MPTTSLDRLADQRVLFLGTEVDAESAHRLMTQLLALSIDDPVSDICLFINSPGGSVLAGFAIYDLMQAVPNDVATVAIGLAASMGQILLCGGAAGKRFAMPNAQILMHEGSAGLGGSVADVAIQTDNLRSTLERMQRIIAHHSGQPFDDVVRDVGRDRWFDAEEARAYGLVDQVVSLNADSLGSAGGGSPGGGSAVGLATILPARASRRVGLLASLGAVEDR